MFQLGVPYWELIVRSLVIYLGLFAALRIFGKREVGQFTLYDLVLVLLVANAVQPAMTGPDNSLAGGLIIIGTLILANYLVSQMDKVPFLHRLITAEPAVLVEDGKYVTKNMEKEGIDQDEMGMAIREHGLEKVSEVKLAVLEEDGSISIVGMDSGGRPPKRRRRYRRRP